MEMFAFVAVALLGAMCMVFCSIASASNEDDDDYTPEHYKRSDDDEEDE